MSKLDPIKLRLLDWIEDHRGTIANVGKLAAVILACGLLAVMIQQCLMPAPIAPPAPTVTATATPFVSTHVPTRTITPTFTRTATWTNTPEISASRTKTATVSPSVLPTNTATKSPTLTVTSQPTKTDTPGFTSTAEPTDTSTPIPAGRDLTKIPGTLTPLLPNSGLSAQEIADLTPTATVTQTPQITPSSMSDAVPTPIETPKRITLPEGCVFHSWYAEFGTAYDVMTFRCPTLFEYGQGVGASD
jgi:hypothetical protein